MEAQTAIHAPARIVGAELHPRNVPDRVRPVSLCCFTIRGLVSRQKLRWVHGRHDLDLSYITDHVIAMGFPSSGMESWYRNPVDDVRDFLESRHAGHYRIWNLCSERAYGVGHFPCEVERFSWDDHTPPPFALVRLIVVERERCCAARELRAYGQQHYKATATFDIADASRV